LNEKKNSIRLVIILDGSVCVDCGDVVEFDIGEFEIDVDTGVFEGGGAGGRGITKISTTFEY
jgi:hypothetical protein